MSAPTEKTVPPTPAAPKRLRPDIVRILKWTLASFAIIVGTPIALALLVLPLFYFASGPTDSTNSVRLQFAGG